MVGDGIFEDNKSKLDELLSNNIKENDDTYIWNLNIKDINKYNFDKEINIESINENLANEYKKAIKLLNRKL